VYKQFGTTVKEIADLMEDYNEEYEEITEYSIRRGRKALDRL